MIRDGIKLQGNALERLPVLIQALKQRSEVVALYSFGGAARNELKPLSDLDFAILLSKQLIKQQRCDKQLKLISIFNNVFRTDEIDLIILNDAPLRFCFTILKTGKLLYFRNCDKLFAPCSLRPAPCYFTLQPIKPVGTSRLRHSSLATTAESGATSNKYPEPWTTKTSAH